MSNPLVGYGLAALVIVLFVVRVVFAVKLFRLRRKAYDEWKAKQG